ncbi:hypothetical protein Tco_0538474 [Tanacetum coccineum]
MNVNIAWEKEEVHVVDVEMDEDHEGEITKIKEALQWSLGEYPFLVFMELKDFVPSCFAIFTFGLLSLSLSSMPYCDLVSFTNILILCFILKASNQS